MHDPPLVLRRATEKDGPALLRLIEALAHYEKISPPDEAAKQRLLEDLVRQPPRFEAYLAELGNGPVGYAIIFQTYSSFLALPTLYLEDLFVVPEHRGKKIGYALFRAMVTEAKSRGCGRMEWAVLDWNQPAIRFYEHFGAGRLMDWQVYRLTGRDFDRILRADG